MFTVKILVNNRLEIIETDLKLNLIQELEKKYSPVMYDYSCLYSKYSKTPKERRF